MHGFTEICCVSLLPFLGRECALTASMLLHLSVVCRIHSMHPGHSVNEDLLRIEFKSFSMMRNSTAGSRPEKDDLDFRLIAF